MNISFSKSPFRKADLTSIWWTCQSYQFTKASNVQKVWWRVTRAKFLSKSTPGICEKPWATSLTLYCSTCPSSSSLVLNTHLHPTIFFSMGVRTELKIFCQTNSSISSTHTLFQCVVSLLDIASLYVIGSFIMSAFSSSTFVFPDRFFFE